MTFKTTTLDLGYTGISHLKFFIRIIIKSVENRYELLYYQKFMIPKKEKTKLTYINVYLFIFLKQISFISKSDIL